MTRSSGRQPPKGAPWASVRVIAAARPAKGCGDSTGASEPKASEAPVAEIDFQAAYVRDLLQPTDYPTFAVEAQGELFKRWKQDKKADIMGYRNHCYTSTVTGTAAPELPAPWLEILDDSLDHFLSHDYAVVAATPKRDVAS